MSQTIQIRRFSAQFRLRPSQYAEKPRLDGMLRTMLSDALELAVENAGVGPEEIVCIRRIHVPVRLRLSNSDSALAAEWAGRLAESIAAAATGQNGAAPGQPAVVRYGSRPLALMDMGASVHQERFERVWAWRQAGLWQCNEEFPTLGQGAEEFAKALVREAHIAVPVLAALARQGRLHKLTHYLDDAWIEVALAVLSGGGMENVASLRRVLQAWAKGEMERAGELLWTARGAVGELHTIDDPGVVGASRHEVRVNDRSFSTAAERSATRIVGSSAILRECRAVVSAEARVSLSVLGLIESEPWLIQAGVAQLLEAAEAVRSAVWPSQARSSLMPQRTPTPPTGKSPAQTRQLPVREKGKNPETRSGSHGAPTRSDREAGGHGDHPSLRDDEFHEQPADTTQERVEGLTEFGGLLFLLHLENRLGIPERVLGSGMFQNRGLAWFQHRLAMTLQAVELDDPAALAFAGLGPVTRHPSADQPLPDEREQQSIEVFAEEIRADLAAMLPNPPWPAPHGSDTHRLIGWISRRPARIVGDPGWIEAHFLLSDVATEIRRVGLDLNPDYIPWLGVVMRFVYE